MTDRPTTMKALRMQRLNASLDNAEKMIATLREKMFSPEKSTLSTTCEDLWDLAIAADVTAEEAEILALAAADVSQEAMFLRDAAYEEYYNHPCP